VKSGFIKSMAMATSIGLITDFFCMNVMGVFGFSRTFAAFLLYEASRRIELKNNFFVFLLIFFSLSLSNIIANTFFSIILNLGFDLRLILVQPGLTGLLGVLIIGSAKAKRYLDVY
jgi:cell shape-determining protein MreD